MIIYITLLIIIAAIVLISFTISSNSQSPDNVIDASLGDPILFEEIIRPKYTISTPIRYRFSKSVVEERITNLLMNIHRRIGTLPDPSEFIIYGTGGIQLIFIYILYCVRELGGSANIYVEVPYFFMIEFIANRLSQIDGVSVSLTFDPEVADVEYIDTIKNPTGEITRSRTDARFKLWDGVYLWPFYSDKPITNILSPLRDEDIAVFSISKSVGIAGARFSYGFCGSEQLRDYISNTNFDISLGVPNMNKIELSLHRRIDSIGDKIGKILKTRFRKLRLVLGDRLLNYSGAYAWVNMSEEEFARFDIITLSGEIFGDTADKSRLSLLISTVNFNEIINRLQNIYK